MIVGVPSEIKPDEYRVAITPAGVRELSARGHEVLIQAGAGAGSAMADEQFAAQGARIVPDARAVFSEAELVLKVKEPQPVEVEMLRAGQTLFTYLHLAAEPELARGLQESGATCVAYETVEDSAGRLPLLAPMSEVAGKIATQAGAFMLEKPLGGRGILLGGVPGVAAATVLVIGGGVVGMNAAFIAIGMQADVFVFDRSIDRLRELDIAFGGRASTVYSSTLAIEEMLPLADLVIGAVLVHGGRAPHVISREQLQLMRRHAVLVDVSIDQGGCFETSRPTTHSEPTFEVDGITHYCVTNMPGAVPITSTYALTNATLPYVLALADSGVEGAMAADLGLAMGLNVRDGEITHPAVIEALAGVGGVGRGARGARGAGVGTVGALADVDGGFGGGAEAEVADVDGGFGGGGGGGGAEAEVESGLGQGRGGGRVMNQN
jgi:alanine dehydrogenase